MVDRPIDFQHGLHAYGRYPYGCVPEKSHPKVHEGYEWLYILSGQLQLVLGEHDLVLRAGEAAEFDTRVPHWFDRAGSERVELLMLFGPQGERIHVRARPTNGGGRGT